MKRFFLLAVILSALIAAPAGAALIQLSASLDGAQANSGNGTGSSAIGTIDLVLDDQTNELSWSGSFSGLTMPFTVAHFHGPAAANESAGVTVGTSVVIDPGGLSGTSVDVFTISAIQAGDLLDGLWYWNVHSQFAPGGEIRGNIAIVPEPGTTMLLMLGLGALATRKR